MACARDKHWKQNLNKFEDFGEEEFEYSNG